MFGLKWLSVGLLGAAMATGALSPSLGAVKLAGMFTDNAVLQQGMPIPVWGTAKDGEKVTVKFDGQTVSARAKDGKWIVRLKPAKVGGPYTMTVSGENTIELRNILVGEVWICSGQSNMQFGLGSAANAAEAIAASADPKLRLYNVAMTCADKLQDDVKGAWVESAPGISDGFSAVGYFFGRDLRKSLGIPIGLINTSWGGSFAEAWTSPAILRARPDLQQIPAQYVGQQPHIPSGLYNGMLRPLVPYAIRGAIWYQGESNAGQAYRYRELFPIMIQDWRDDWAQGDFPFFFVQLAPFEFEPISSEPKDSAWAELREAQLLTSQTCPKTGMAVITDAGDAKDIHPTRKQPVGERLALIARATVYGQHIEYSGPIYKSMVVKGSRAILSFDHVGGGLVAQGGPLKGFAIAGADGKFVWAHASIVGDRVVVSSPRVSNPVAVRYGWANCPEVNLFNKAGLPASPFRTDDFQMITGPKK